MDFTFLVLNLIGIISLTDGYSRECDFNHTIFAPEGSTATFIYNLSEHMFFRHLTIEKTSGPTKGYLLFLFIHNGNVIDTNYLNEAWKKRTNTSSQVYSDHQFNVKIDLKNVSMEDNGTYRARDFYIACHILYVMQMRIIPNISLEENEPVHVLAHPQASLIKRPLSNATMVWLLDGESVNRTANFIQQDGRIWISNIKRGLHGKNVTYRAAHDERQNTDVNATITVKYGPSLPLKLVPRKTYYNLVSGNTMPDITCSSECNPPCNTSWGEHSNDKTLSLGEVKTEDSGEYTCTATRSDGGGQTAWQSISILVADRPIHVVKFVPRRTHYNLVSGDTMPDITCTSECNPPCYIFWQEHSNGNILSLGVVTLGDSGEYVCIARRSDGLTVEKTFSLTVSDNSKFTVAIVCLATVQCLVIIVLGLLAFFMYRRKVPSCCKRQFFSNKPDTTKVTFSPSHLEGSKNETYEDLQQGARDTVHNAYGEVNMSITEDDVSVSTYENTNVRGRITNVHQH